MPSNLDLLASVARSALPWGSRKLRAKPSLTRTTSPIWPSLATRSSKITSMVLSPWSEVLAFRGTGLCAARRNARPQRGEGLEQAERRHEDERPAEQHDREIETGEHDAARGHADGDRVHDRKAEQRIDEDEARREDAADQPEQVGQEHHRDRDREHGRGECREGH